MTLVEAGSDRGGERSDATVADCEPAPGDSQSHGLVQRLREIVSDSGDEASGELAGGPSEAQQDTGVQKTGPASFIVEQIAEVASAIRG